ncbi:MAG: MotA/TolQ/ExbB proton channel family protein [Dethiobacter sp.]|jgi:chemotaxis protein MotA|nr:MotA/TolQ/ExbB proton channel family protein [Dethiobacter sp.]
MKKMDMLTVLGIISGVVLVLAAILSKGSLGIFYDSASLMITIGGSFSALLIRFQVEQIKMVLNVTKNAFFTEVASIGDIITEFVRLGQKARREGLLSLEEDIEEMTDPFIKKGLQMVVDGIEPGLIKDIMYIQLDSLESRHKLGQELFKFWGALAPAFGMIGTLIGLILMLVNLSDVAAIGPGMAVALLTTFYGALLSNLVFIPIAGKLEMRSEAEITVKEAVIEGVLAIQAGTNPRILQEKLKAFISPREKETLELGKKPSARGTEEVLIDES